MSQIISSIGNFLTGGSKTTGQQAAQIADPFASQRPQYQTMLSQLMANPSEVTQLPGYQFNFNQGLQALQRQEAASGTLASGTGDIAAVQYGQNYATSAFQTYEQMLAQLAGANTGSPGTAGSLYASGANAAGSAGSSFLASLLGSFNTSSPAADVSQFAVG